MIVLDIPDVPDVSAEWYRRIIHAAADLPGPLQAAAAFATEAVLAVYLAAFALLWWRARTRPASVAARAFAAPVVTVLAYALSDAARGWKAVDGPCRLGSAAPPIAPCPEVGDWSFPSNHAAVAGAVAVAVLWSAVRLGLVVLVIAVAAAASRVVVGVQFPHDVGAGVLLGALVATALPTIARMGETTVVRLRSGLGILLYRPAIITVPAAFLTMIIVSQLTTRLRPPDVDHMLLQLHAPEWLGLGRDRPERPGQALAVDLLVSASVGPERPARVRTMIRRTRVGRGRSVECGGL